MKQEEVFLGDKSLIGMPIPEVSSSSILERVRQRLVTPTSSIWLPRLTPPTSKLPLLSLLPLFRSPPWLSLSARVMCVVCDIAPCRQESPRLDKNGNLRRTCARTCANRISMSSSGRLTFAALARTPSHTQQQSHL